MEAMKAEKYQCSFKGISTLDQQAENDNEFNHSDGLVTAFSCQDALSQWLKEMWDVSLSIAAPSPPNNEVYGETYSDFIESNDVEFTLFEVDKNHLRMQINYKGRNDFYYEISIIKQ